MDDMFGAWNWMKTCCIGASLRSRMDRALDEGGMQTDVHTEFTEALQVQHPDKIADAQERISTWEACDQLKAPNTRCPYYTPKLGLSIAQVNLQTEEAAGSATCEVARALAKEDAVLADCLLRGLRAEDERARIAAKHDGESGTDKQATTRTTMLKNLALTIADFRTVQEHAMSATYTALSTNERDPTPKTAMTVALGIPSDPLDGDRTLVSDAARAMEAKYRWALMQDELDRLLHQLRLKGCLYKHRVAQVTGQKASTRSHTAQAAVSANVKKAADAYRRHRAAYEVLVGDGSWKDVMRDLKDSECRPLGDRLIEQMEKMAERKIKKFLEGKSTADTSGETAYKLPWIWYSWGGKTGTEITEQLIVEWAKSRARAQHWVQEVRLVEAEMQRVIDYSESMAVIWDARRDYNETVDLGPDQSWVCDDAWTDGIRAYASKQAYIRRAHASRWTQEFVQLRMEARRFLSVHTDDGLSIEPLTVLSADEVEDMRQRAKLRRERRSKAKRANVVDADSDAGADEANLELFEEDMALQKELDALAAGFTDGSFGSNKGFHGRKPKARGGGATTRRKR
ncbi:unnamed protein product [Peniophora sp. CBMAI 1063]|nr:unnamed protein product [Peniophora sp. CBMAI 1063]